MSFRIDPATQEKIRRIREFWLCRDACEKIQDVEAYELVGDVEFLLELVEKSSKEAIA